MNQTNQILVVVLGLFVLMIVSPILIEPWTPAEQDVYYDMGYSAGAASTNNTEYTNCASYVSMGEPSPNPGYYAVHKESIEHIDQNRYKYCQGFVDGYASRHIDNKMMW